MDAETTVESTISTTFEEENRFQNDSDKDNILPELFHFTNDIPVSIAALNIVLNYWMIPNVGWSMVIFEQLLPHIQSTMFATQATFHLTNDCFQHIENLDETHFRPLKDHLSNLQLRDTIAVAADVNTIAVVSFVHHYHHVVG